MKFHRVAYLNGKGKPGGVIGNRLRSWGWTDEQIERAIAALLKNAK